MDTRDLKTLTVGTHTVELKTWLTGGEYNKIKAVNVSVDYNTEERAVSKTVSFSPSLTIQRELKALEVCVATLDGNADNLVQRLEDLRMEEYQQIIDAINEIFKNFTTPKSKPTGADTSTSGS